MSFRTIINYELIYRYLFLICPKLYIIYLITAIILFSLLEYSNIAWNTTVLILLLIVGVVLKKKICRFVIERYMDLYNEQELHGKIVFSNEALIQTFESMTPEEQVSIIAAVKAKMPQIKIIGGEKR